MQSRMSEYYTSREQVEAMLAEAREAVLEKPRVYRRKYKHTNRTKLRKVFHIFLNAAYAIVVALLLLGLYIGVQAKLNNRPASILGYRLFQVETGSMVPTLPIGSYIVVREPNDPNALAEGTVITFRTSGGSIITHRIIEVINDGDIKYRTKGDNPQNIPDLELVTHDRVLGTLQFSVSLPKVWKGQ